MIKKIVLDALKKLSREERNELRKAFKEDEDIVADASEDKGDTLKEKETRKEDAYKAQKDANDAADDSKQIADLERGEETKAKDEEEEPKTEEGEEAKDLQEADAEAEIKRTESDAQVAAADNYGNGVRVDDLVTKEHLAEMLAAHDAKYEAILAENKALKEKYEDPDFGNHKKKGVGNSDRDRIPYEDFEEYSSKYKN